MNDVRKVGGWKEVFSPYDVSDYRGLKDEYKATQGSKLQQHAINLEAETAT